MVETPLTMEDRSDEDFFDKLVDEDDDSGGDNGVGKLSFSSNDEHVFENLAIEEVESAFDALGNVDRVEGDGSDKSGSDDVVSRDLSDVKGDDIGGCAMESQDGVDVKSIDPGLSENSEANSSICGNDLDVSLGIEEVKGSGFSGGTRKASFSNYFGQIEDESADPFAEVVGDSMVASVSSDVKSSDRGLSEISEVNSNISGNDLDVSSGIEEVKGSGFSGGTRKASFSNYFGQIEDDSTDPFAEVVGDSMVSSVSLDSNIPSNDTNCSTSSYGFGENGGDFQQNSYVESKKEVVDQNSIEYWESMYPGWRYDPNTGQWVQVDAVDPNVNNMEISNINVQSMFDGTAVNSSSDSNYLHHTTQSAMSGSMPQEGTTGTSMYWNQASYGNTEYPAHMVFDQNYPGWYYDTIAQEWRSLEFYFQSINQSTTLDQSKELSYQSQSAVNYNPEKNNMNYGQSEQVNSHSYQLNQSVSLGGYEKDASNTMQNNNNTQYENGFASNDSFSYEQSSKSFDSSKALNGFPSFGNNNAHFQNFAAAGNTSYHLNYGNTLQPNYHNKEFNHQFSPSNFNSPNTLNFSQQSHQNSGLSYSSNEGRSIDGRPPHALVSFGFGGKLVVMKHQSSLYTQPAYASPDSAGGVISLFNLMELAMNKSDGSNIGFSDCDYIRTLCEQSFPSPLSSGNVGNKELNKWIDDRIANCDDIKDADYRKGEVLKMVLSLLKIACQFYGKLRSSFGADRSSKETDYPESALAKLFSSAKRNTTQFSAVSHCLRNMPSEAQVQATAEKVQMLLVSGRRIEALQCAQQGHLWGPAIVIASLLGDQFYGETVKQMALHQLVAGSPLRTLCLLIAGQPAEVFSNSVASNAQDGVNVPQSSWVGPGSMLDNWEENLAVISANRTNGDELVITHLGDCLWKERGEVMSAHICYLVAEASIESYSESARLCLVGADHLKYPRTYASPQAIQRTELYEYAKVLGNSQFVLLPFQPYKLIYACMLVEVGKLSDSLKYCQAVLKSLKTGRSPEVDTWRNMISSLEDRIKVHQQGGYGTNPGRAKLVGKLLNFFDNTAHRVVGGLPPPTPSPLQSNGQHSEYDNQSKGPRVSTSQSTMAMSSLMTSSSAEGSDLKPHSRSMSEPNFGRMPRKEESPKASSSSPRDNTSAPNNPSRLGRFGSQIFQKTVGLVLRARPDRQAKLGETNKFYYDEKLKRWVEEGAESQPEEVSLGPPPTTSSFINGNLDHHGRKEESSNSVVYANGNGESEFKHAIPSGKGSELPPIPSTSNHFSARGRMGVRSRYVDTFNKGGQNQVNSFQSPTPSISTMKSPLGNPKFFVPTQVPESAQSPQQNIITDHDSASSNGHDTFSSPQIPTPVPTIPRYPSMDNGMGIPGNSNGNLPPNPRRTLSWGEDLDQPNHDIANMSEISLSGPTPGFQ